MQRGLVGSEMCIRDRYQRRVHGNPMTIPCFPEPPWIKRCTFGIKFTDEIQMVDEIQFEEEAKEDSKHTPKESQAPSNGESFSILEKKSHSACNLNLQQTETKLLITPR
eukprot:TRINITY_DN35103_c0_g1_i1.p3 TRINITY_DN35103_c0_g1~~TRINITY_DN35103_c0_g1_i1.p3  ORF type:complete len:109 (+),score=32.28 TRINITY_DN35103_c0_g1_i1:148-474(+)